MKRKKLFWACIVLFSVYCVYLTAAVYENDFWGNILSPLLAFGAFGIVFLTSLELDWKQNRGRKCAWIFFSLSCLVWALADLTWVMYVAVFAEDPMESFFALNMYNFTNIFLFIGTGILCVRLLKRWNFIQLKIDTVSTAMAIGYLIWIVFLDKRTDFPEIVASVGWLGALSIFIDIMLLTLIFTTYFSVRKGKVAVYIMVMMFGIIIYAISDLIYFHFILADIYIPNSLVDAVSMLAFMLLAAGACKKRCMDKPTMGLEDYADVTSNVGLKKNFYLIVLVPIVAVAVEGLVLFDLFVFALIFAIREALSFYIQLAIKNEQLLLKEKEMNSILEDKIKERTKEIVQKNDELEYSSNHDPVTDLYNRNFIMKSLPQSVRNLKPNETVTFILLDIDRFKTINDMYGHDVGDQVLVELTNRLQSVDSDFEFIEKPILARVGGDEFAFVYRSFMAYDYAEKIANKILLRGSEPIAINQYLFRITASIGISIYPYDARDVKSLMRNSDIALNHAKVRGKNRCLSFNSELRDSIYRKNEIEILLKTMDYNEELEMFYQPQFRIYDKKLIGAEALIRWYSKSLGYISPAEFIPIAEEINIIPELGNWILNTVIHQIKEWNTIYGIDFKVGINISPKQLDYISFVNDLKQTMSESNVPPRLVDIEITESIAMEGEDRIKQVYSLFKGLGVSISMDDFGTGYSALSNLKYLPFEKIKIAKELIDAIAMDEYDMQIVKSIIELAKSLGILTIAEGVEYQEQFDILEKLGCDEIQGYLLGRPMAVDKFEEQFLK